MKPDIIQVAVASLPSAGFMTGVRVMVSYH